jgi:hypothetical protein
MNSEEKELKECADRVMCRISVDTELFITISLRMDEDSMTKRLTVMWLRGKQAS